MQLVDIDLLVDQLNNINEEVVLSIEDSNIIFSDVVDAIDSVVEDAQGNLIYCDQDIDNLDIYKGFNLIIEYCEDPISVYYIKVKD